MSPRLDLALVERGLARSRSQAAAAVREGRVRVDGRVTRRPAAPVRADGLIEVDGTPRVSRAGRKLEAALDAFGVDVAGRVCLDLGASTGGFTEVLLDRGAAAVTALDVGHGQLVAELRTDPRVTAVEGENARALTAARLAELGVALPQLVVIDLSFIPLGLVLPAVVATAPQATVICLIKPQFEVGRGAVGDGVVHDVRERAAAIGRVLAAARASGLAPEGLIPSPITGEHGNREALVLLRPAGAAGVRADPPEWDLLAIAAGVDGAEGAR